MQDPLDLFVSIRFPSILFPYIRCMSALLSVRALCWGIFTDMLAYILFSIMVQVCGVISNDVGPI